MEEIRRHLSLLKGGSPYDLAIRVKLAKKYRSACKIVPLEGNCWILGVSVVAEYAPIQIEKETEVELRMRVAGAAVCSGSSIYVFDCEMGIMLHNITTVSQSIYTVSISNPPICMKIAPLIAVGTHEGFAELYDIQTGDLLYDTVSRHRHPASVRAIHVHEGKPWAVMIAGLENGEVHVWAFERETEEAVFADHSLAVTAITICVQNDIHLRGTRKSPAFIVTASLDGNIFVYNFRTYERIEGYSFMQEHCGPVNCVVSFCSPQCWVISAGQSSVLKVWNLLSFMDGSEPLLRELRGHSGAVNALAAINTSRPSAVSGGDDFIIRVWDLDAGIELVQLVGHMGPIRGLSATLIPRILIVSGSYDGTVRVWDMSESADPQVRYVPNYLRAGDIGSSGCSVDVESATRNLKVRYIQGIGYVYEDEDDEEEEKRDVNESLRSNEINEGTNARDAHAEAIDAIELVQYADRATNGRSSLPPIDIMNRRASTGSIGRLFTGSKLL